MKKSDPISKARQLLREGRHERARDLLLEEGYVKRLDPRVQEAYNELITVSPSLRERLSGDLNNLRDPDRDVRLKAARSLSKEARCEYSTHRREWMRDPRTSGALIDALNESDDEIREQVTAALAVLIERYFRDLRAFRSLERSLRSARKAERLFGVLGIGYLNNSDRWKLLVPLLKDSAASVRQEVCIAVMGAARRREISAAARKLLLPALLEALDDDDAEVRTTASNAILHLGDNSALAAIKRRMAKENDPEAKSSLKRALGALKGKTGGREA